MTPRFWTKRALLALAATVVVATPLVGSSGWAGPDATTASAEYGTHTSGWAGPDATPS